MYKKIVKICIFLDCDTNKKIQVFKNSCLSIIIFVIITYIVHWISIEYSLEIWIEMRLFQNKIKNHKMK